MTGLEGRVGLAERIGERSGELKALPISEAVSVLSLLGVGEGCECVGTATAGLPAPLLVLMDRGIERSFWDSLSFSAKTLMVLGCIQPIHSEGNQPWVFFGRNDAKAETPVLWPPHAKS